MDNNKTWVDKLEVTAPIKGLMEFVDTLTNNYETRITQLQQEYQNDIEEVMACYKRERQEFEETLQAQTEELILLKQRIEQLQLNYNNEVAAHEITKENLATKNLEFIELTKQLHTEEELIAKTNLRIRLANEILEHEIEGKIIQKSGVISKTREFFAQIISGKINRANIIAAKTSVGNMTEQ